MLIFLLKSYLFEVLDFDVDQRLEFMTFFKPEHCFLACHLRKIMIHILLIFLCQ